MHNIQALSIVGAIALADSAAASAQQAWSIVENKSPTNDGEQLSAAMVVGGAALILRCREPNLPKWRFRPKIPIWATNL